LQLTGLASPFIKDFNLGDTKTAASQNLAANIVSTLQAGCFLGSLAASPLTDKFGRKWCLITGKHGSFRGDASARH
jgi:MFS family permease